VCLAGAVMVGAGSVGSAVAAGASKYHAAGDLSMAAGALVGLVGIAVFFAGMRDRGGPYRGLPVPPPGVRPPPHDSRSL
jgi:hypothetical protein